MSIGWEIQKCNLKLSQETQSAVVLGDCMADPRKWNMFPLVRYQHLHTGSQFIERSFRFISVIKPEDVKHYRLILREPFANPYQI